MALIGILSDSHGEQQRTRAAINLLLKEGCARIYHLGDVETLEVLDELAGHPISLVFGNCDVVNRLADYAQDLGIDVQHPKGTTKYEHYSIGYLHGDRFDHYHQLLDDEAVQVVFHGHTHETRDEIVENTRCINPGALHRSARYTVATFDTQTDELNFIEVEV